MASSLILMVLILLSVSVVSPPLTEIVTTIWGNDTAHVCESYGGVTVRVPSIAVLNVQSERLSVGYELPIYPMLPKEIVATILGNDGAHVCETYGGVMVRVPSIAVLNVQSEWLSVGYERPIYPVLPEVLGFSAAENLFVERYESRPHDSEAIQFGDNRNLKGLGFVNIFSARYADRANVAVCPSCLIPGKNILSIFAVPDLPLALGVPMTWIFPPHYTTESLLPSSFEVAQIRVTGKNFKVPVMDLAVGAEKYALVPVMDLAVGAEEYTLGNPFYEAYNGVPADVETNYPAILHFNNTFGERGSVYVKVGAHIHPQNLVLHVGHSLNFTVKGLTGNLNGKWFTTNDSVILADIISGRAAAVGEGSAQVIFLCPHLNLQTTVNVTKGNLISVHAPREVLSNVPYPTEGYKFSVKFSAHGGKYEALGNGKEILYDCAVDPPFLGNAEPWLDPDTSNSYCLFFPYPPEIMWFSVPDGVRPDITISVNASLRESKHVSGSASALFVGGFSLLETDEDSLQLNLPSDSKRAGITIVGNTDVEIDWREKDSVMVTPVRKAPFRIVGRARYEVRALKTKKFKDNIIITVPASGQRFEVDVNYEPEEGTEEGTSIKLWASILVGAVVLTLVEVWYTGVLVAPADPDRSSPSERPPQPIPLDYVRIGFEGSQNVKLVSRHDNVLRSDSKTFWLMDFVFEV